jgi:hydroxymethylpyrimidine/phosphomethylpyrimidine kinase
MARGASIHAAVARAKNYVTQAIRSNPGLGHGAGPLNHFAASGLKAGAR